jgi:sugar lactone lactonase YvrE
LAAGDDGTLYYSHHTSVWRSRDGRSEIVAGRGGGTESAAVREAVSQADSLALDAAGNLFVTDLGRNVIVRIDTAGHVEPVAGNGTMARFGDGGQATGASFSCGTLLVGQDGRIYFTDPLNDRIAVLTPDGRIDTYAGNGDSIFGGDGGPAREASILAPGGMAMGPDGGIYVADFGHNRVCRIDPAGIIGTVAGNGQQGFSGDGGAATAAALDGPGGLAVDAAGRLYIGDSRNLRVRRVDGHGVITTVAGNGEEGEPASGAPAIGSPLGRPGALGVTADGDLLVAGDAGDAVRRITPAGTVHTQRTDGAVVPILDVAAREGRRLLVGSATGPHSRHVDAALPGLLAAEFGAPAGPRRLGGVAFDTEGEWLYACDAESRRILRTRLGSAQ